ncbi:MAG: hypothetical protein ACRYG7_43905 [Janthinobacterium lividum]
MSLAWMQGLVALALLSTGVVYGTDVFFALVARPALRRADEASLTQVLGHLHAVADARMPVLGAMALVATAALAAGGWGTSPGQLALLALGGQLTQLLAYLRGPNPSTAPKRPQPIRALFSPMPGRCKRAGTVSLGYGLAR